MQSRLQYQRPFVLRFRRLDMLVHNPHSGKGSCSSSRCLASCVRGFVLFSSCLLCFVAAVAAVIAIVVFIVLSCVCCHVCIVEQLSSLKLR
jgi:hypothetical protein